MSFRDWKTCTALFPQCRLRYKQSNSFPGLRKLLPTTGPSLESEMEKTPKWQWWKTRGKLLCAAAQGLQHSPSSDRWQLWLLSHVSTRSQSCTSSQEPLKEDTGENTVRTFLAWEGSHSNHPEGSNSVQGVSVALPSGSLWHISSLRSMLKMLSPPETCTLCFSKARVNQRRASEQAVCKGRRTRTWLSPFVMIYFENLQPSHTEKNNPVHVLSLTCIHITFPPAVWGHLFHTA